MSSSTNAPIGFSQLFAQREGGSLVSEIEVPLIQRDFAQGRKTSKVNRIRKQFINALCKALLPRLDSEPLDLDFIYGNIDENKRLIPLDGQQRLTSLFLLHCYLAWRVDVRPCEQPWGAFSYATRPGARAFCEFLTEAQPCANTFTDGGLSEWLRDDAQFLPAWDHDPTVQSMIVVLDDLNDWFRVTPEAIPQVAWQKLTAPSSAIRFVFLSMAEVGLSDVHYIKMNSRGRSLTNFENFKARIEGMLEDTHPEESAEFATKVDNVWTDVFWKYRVNHEIDDSFLRYFRFALEVCAWRSGVPLPAANQSDDLGYMCDLADSVLNDGAGKAKENIRFLFHAFDTWVGVDIHAEFEALLTDSSCRAGERVFLFNSFDRSEGGNLFSACSRSYGQQRWTHTHTLLLYGIMIYRRASSPEIGTTLFLQRLRILRNLTAASDDEIRASNMPKLLSDVEALILHGALDQVLTFNQAQKENEQRKTQMLECAEHLRTVMYELEDHLLLRGSLMAFELNPDRFEPRARAFLHAFSAPSIDVTGALLTHGDYSRKASLRESGYRFIELGAPEREEPWRRLFRSSVPGGSPMVKPLMAFLDAVTGGRSLTHQIEQYVNDPAVAKDWRYYLVKYPAMRDGDEGRYAFDESGYKAVMTRNRSGVRGYYYDPYLRALVRLRGVPADFATNHNSIFSGYEDVPRWLVLTKSRLKLRSVAEGWEVADIPTDAEFQGDWDRLMQRYDTVEAEDGRVTIRVPKIGQTDAIDRIEFGSELVKAAVDLGL